MDIEQENIPREFDWDEAARTVGATPKQVAFCKAKLAGMSNTGAARAAGYGGNDSALRSTAYQVSRGPKVSSLMALAAAGGAGVLDDILTDTEAKRILSRMARQGDANSKVRAIQALEQMKAQEAARREQADASPEAILALMLRDHGVVGALVAVASYMDVHKTLVGFPMAERVLPLVKSEFPEAWAKFNAAIKDAHHLSAIAAMAAGPVLSEAQILANGADGANGTANEPVPAATPDAAA